LKDLNLNNSSTFRTCKKEKEVGVEGTNLKQEEKNNKVEQEEQGTAKS